MALTPASFFAPILRVDRQMKALRVLWVLGVLVELTIFAASLPAYFAQLHLVCASSHILTCTSWAQPMPGTVAALTHLGLTVNDYALYTFALHLLASLVFLSVGGLIFWRKHADWYGLFVSFLLMVFGVVGAAGVLILAFFWAYPALSGLVQLLNGLVFAVLGLFLVTFPNGRFVPRWSWVIALFWVAQNLLIGVIETLPEPLFGLQFLVIWGSTLLVQIYRYRRVSTAIERQQTKWLLAGLALGASSAVLYYPLKAFPALGAPDSPYGLLEGTVAFCLFTPIPLAIGIAILRYRLWDIDPLMNRALVYGGLTACVIGIYVLIVGSLGALFRLSGNPAVSLVAAGLVAVLFQPLRGWLQRGVNRLMYGQRDEPYAVVARLGRRLESTLAPEAALSAIVETVAQALKLPYAALRVQQGDEVKTAAAYGAPVEPVLTLPLTYQGEFIGQFVLGPRQRGETFSPADRRLLEDLARQIGMAAHAVRLTADLQRSRERLVTAREEERRRLRRDLHDGLGPTLGGLTLKVGAIRNLLPRDQATADALLAELSAEIEGAVGDIRRLVYELRPPSLDELGLVGAIQARAAHYGIGRSGERTADQSHDAALGLAVVVEAPEHLSPLPAAVEVAAYRIVLEALANVARHAQAQTCQVRLRVSDALEVEVRDDGLGLPGERHMGVGLVSMRERAAELGGTCVIESPPAGGMRVLARLPLPKE